MPETIYFLTYVTWDDDQNVRKPQKKKKMKSTQKQESSANRPKKVKRAALKLMFINKTKHNYYKFGKTRLSKCRCYGNF